MLKRIVVASDGTERAGRAVEFAGELAERFGADLTVVAVRRPGEDAPAGVRKHAIACNATLELVEGEEPAQAIIDSAARLDADAIVVGNAGMSGRREFLLANVPNRISHNAGCTVIIVDTRDAKERKRG